jgi:hypothetical protein
MGDPTSSYATACIALRVSGALKPHHHDKVETPSVGPTTLYELFLLPIPATYPVNLILLHLTILLIFGEDKAYEIAHCVIFSGFCYFHLLLLSPLPSKTRNLCSCLNVRDQVSHPHESTILTPTLHLPATVGGGLNTYTRAANILISAKISLHMYSYLCLLCSQQ